MDIDVTHPALLSQNIVLRVHLWRTPVLLKDGQILKPVKAEKTSLPFINHWHYEITKNQGEVVKAVIRPDVFELIPFVEIDGALAFYEPQNLTGFDHRYAQLIPVAQAPFVLSMFGVSGGMFGMLATLLAFLLAWYLTIKINFNEFYKNQPDWTKYILAFFMSLFASLFTIVFNRIVA